MFMVVCMRVLHCIGQSPCLAYLSMYINIRTFIYKEQD